MTFSFDELLPNGPCDICGATDGIKWWRDTAARVCGNQCCYSEHHRRYDAHLQKQLQESDGSIYQLGTGG